MMSGHPGHIGTRRDAIKGGRPGRVTSTLQRGVESLDLGIGSSKSKFP